MDSTLEEVIEEPFLEASCCTFHDDSSETIQYYYKLKYPDVYSLHSNSVINLLDNEKTFSDLKHSVKSFISRVRNSYKSNGVFNSLRNKADTQRTVIPIYDNSWHTATEKSAFGKATDFSKISSPSTDLTLYDSVHSIKVPLRTYKNTSKHENAKTLKQNDSITSTISDVTQQMNGLVFDRVEKTIPLAVRYKNCHSDRSAKVKGEFQKNKSICLSMLQNNQVGSPMM